MSLFDLARKQFIEVIEWNETADGVLSYRYPVTDREIQNGARLTVRESQLALFVNEGVVADLFKPGLYTLTTHTLPVLTTLKNWDKLFKSPFKSDVYFFSTREQINQRWGTPSPIVIRDKELGQVRLRANGVYSYTLKDPKVFFTRLSGTRESFTTEDLREQLNANLLTDLASYVASAGTSFLDMAASQSKFSAAIRDNLAPAFEPYGLELKSFLVQSITLPEDLQAYLDKATSMRMVGDLQRYAQFQAADSIPIAAANQGGLAGAGAGMAAGVAMGQQMAAAFNAPNNSNTNNSSNNANAAAVPGPASDPVALLNSLHELLTKGILTQAEFDAKKAELLRKIT